MSVTFGGLLAKGLRVTSGQALGGLACLAAYVLVLAAGSWALWPPMLGLFGRMENAVVAQVLALLALAVGWAGVWTAVCFSFWQGLNAAAGSGWRVAVRRAGAVWSVMLAKGLVYLPFAGVGGLCLYRGFGLWWVTGLCVTVMYMLSVLFTPSTALAVGEGKRFFGCLAEAARITWARGYWAAFWARAAWAVTRAAACLLVGLLSRYVLDSPSFYVDTYLARYAGYLEPLFRLGVAPVAAVALRPLTAPVAANMARALCAEEPAVNGGGGAALVVDIGVLGVFSALGIYGIGRLAGGSVAPEAAAAMWLAMTLALYGVVRAVCGLLLRRRTFGAWLTRYE